MIDIRQFGALGDGVQPDHEAIQRAIDTCAQQGGGTVLVPSGRYRCGTLRLKSHVNLHLDSGAVILGSHDMCDYQIFGNSPDPKIRDLHALIAADNQTDISISGLGIIDGNAPVSQPGTEFRPAMLFIRNCRNVTCTGVHLRNPDFWTFHLQRCCDVVIRGIRITADQNRINTDGIDPDGCTNVIISDCIITTGDDSICLKSTDGTPCENIVVSNCILSSHEAACKLGTEGLGPIRNVLFSNCVVRQSGSGCALYMKDGGPYENITFSDITMQTTRDYSLIMDVTPRYHGTSQAGRIRNVTFRNITSAGPGRCYIEGHPLAQIENVTFDSVTWEINGMCDFGRSPKPQGTIRTQLDPLAADYTRHPFQCTVVHVRGLHIRNMRLTFEKGVHPDRGMFFLKEVHGASLEVSDTFTGSTDHLPVKHEDCSELITPLDAKIPISEPNNAAVLR